MLKKMINSARIEFEIIPIDPLLIKSGQATVGGVDMSFVRTYRSGEKAEPFIPGSSLKGMIRAYAEKICRSLRDNPVPVCLPYLAPSEDKTQKGEERQFSCGLHFKKDRKVQTISSPEIYKFSCPACRLFGSHGFVGRFAASDAYLTENFKSNWLVEIRDGVAIDRITGGTAGGAKYDLEVLTRGEFKTTIEIRNFERWQLGLIGLVLRDMEEGLVRIGFGKSRGLGRFKANITMFELTYYNRSLTNLSGLGKLCSADEIKSYGLFPETGDGSIPLPKHQPRRGLRYEYDLKDSWKEVLEPAVNDLVRFVEKTEWPKNLENFLKERN